MFKVKLLRQSGLIRLLFILQVVGFVVFSPLSSAVVGEEEYEFVTEWGSFGTDEGQFHSPYDIAIDSEGNVYVTEHGNHRIQKFTANGEFLAQWGALGTGEGQFYHPTSIDIDSNDHVYITDSRNFRIQKFTADGQFLAQWGSEGVGDGQFSHPLDVTIDVNGEVYAIDSSVAGHRIQKFTADGQFLIQWNPQGMDNGQIYSHTDMAVDTNGNVYFASQVNATVQKFNSNGQFLIQWGSWSLFNNPLDIAVDINGNVYVSDYGNNGNMGNSRIQKFNSNGEYITQWELQGTENGRATGITVDDNGNVYITDSANNRIQKFAPKTNCANPATYDTATRIVSVPKVDVATLDVITGQPTDQIAVVSLQLQQQPGIDDFMIIDDSLQFLEFSTDYNPEHARYDYNTAQFWSGGKLSFCAQVPSVVVLPTGQMLAAPPKSYAVIMRQLAINPNVFHVETITPLP